MSTSLAASLLSSISGQCVVPLEVSARGYRDVAEEELSVSHVRHVRCRTCAGRGCARCASVGWLFDASTTKVLVPQGTTVGARIDVAGAGDEIDGVARALVVEVVRPGPRADELRALQKDFENKLETAWRMEAATHASRRRRRRLLLAAVPALLAAVAIGRWLHLSTTGETCIRGGDCRSGHCIRLMTLPESSVVGVEHLDGRVCTTSCKTDLDCPASMRCRDRANETPTTPPASTMAPTLVLHGWGRRGAPTAEAPRTVALDVPDGFACIPHGY